MNTKTKKKANAKKKTESSKEKEIETEIFEESIDTNGKIATSRLSTTSNFR